MAVELEGDLEFAAAAAASAAAAAATASTAGGVNLERLALRFELLRDAVALSQSALSYHPGQLRAQLIGRLAGCVEPTVVKLLERARDVGSALVPPKTLIPRHQCMNRAGQGRIRTRRHQDTWVSSVALSGDGSLLISGGYDCSVRVFRLPGGEPVKVLEGHRHAVRAVAVSADGALAASGSEDRTVLTWDLNKREGEERALELLGHRAAVRAVCLTPDGRWLVSGAEDNEARVWNVSSGACTALLSGHERPVTGVAVSLDGSRVGTSSQDWTNKFFDAATGECLRTWKPYLNTVVGVVQVAYSVDSWRLERLLVSNC